jgi:SEC-C motif
MSPHSKGGVPCAKYSTKNTPFEPMSKRRRGYPSEARVKIGVRVVHGDKLLEEKLGRNDLCPCGSGLRFKRCCLKSGRF